MPGRKVEVLVRESDVTSEVLSAAKPATDDATRERAIEAATQKLVDSCEQTHRPHHCSVRSFFLGRQYRLFETLELGDLRVVYAPPAGVGQFGGRVDRHAWPRQAGDFALLRAYTAADGTPAGYAKENVPYKPDPWLHVGDEGIEPGAFVMVAGYPAHTDRYLPAVEIARYTEQVLPARIGLYQDWLEVIDRQGKRSPALAVKVAMHKRQIEELLASTRARLEALNKLHLTELREREEQRLHTWCSVKPDRKQFCDAFAELEKLSATRREAFPRTLLLDNLRRGPSLLAIGIDLVQRARQHAVVARQRTATYADDNAGQLWKQQEHRLHGYDPRVDAELLASLVLRARHLPQATPLEPLSRLAGNLDDKQRDALARRLEARFRSSTLSNEKHVRELFDAADAAALEKSRDPVIALARDLADLLAQRDAERARERGTESRVGPRYFQMLDRSRTGPLYPDANGTLRVSYGTVTGYDPEDGLRALPQTTLHGAINKATGESPFNLPRRLLEKAAAAGESYWADPDLDDVPLCFLSSADTAGSPGGPVIDGRGHLVGLDFDRVWEDAAGDFVYRRDRSRSIGVDIRYMLWLLDRVEDAGALLRELGVSSYRSAPSRR